MQKFEFYDDLRWSSLTKRIAGIVGLAGLSFAALAMYLRGGNVTGFWQIALPILMGLLCFGLTGFLINYREKWERIKELPGIDYPFRSVAFFFGLHIFLFIYVLLFYFLSLLAASSWLLAVISSPVMVIIFLVALFTVTAAGGQVIANEQKNGTIYRDTVSQSIMTRQDILFSHAGSWDKGIIFGWKTFPYAAMKRYEKEGKALTIYGTEDDGKSYVFVIYTPRNIKWAETLLAGKF